ncbi:MAG: AMP-binding protein [Bryobacteraceae bacterium]|nr:AMP-binding protein [Bryobacteraceae bacterium]
MRLTLPELMEARAQSCPARCAISGLERPALTYAGLRGHLAATAAALRRWGVTRGDRVAIVLPNGPAMATAVLSASAVGASAPLNPSYGAEEFDFCLSDLNAKVVVVEAGSDSPAVAVAGKRGIRVLEIDAPSSAPAGMFTVRHAREGPDGHDLTAAPDDVALVLHTSGTTSRPKIVPLTHANLCASAESVAASLALTAEDRCLNIMPLFHIHGLVAGLLASLWAGASVVCSPGFNAPRFLDWVDATQPTWYTAVPTMHQSILAQARKNGARRFRFIRSSSAPLAPQLMAQMEQTFGAPVIEAYGMTEAAHQIASNPLPPARRKPGTVGLPAGPEVRVVDGEVLLRGPNVTRGYEGNPEANAGAFVDGWFRTGDQGFLDEDGYLTLTGRLKEIINRGGEKISPREVEEVILDYPPVSLAVVFAAPDTALGEAVAAAVVLRDGESATATEIRKYAASRLAPFKVPATIVFLEEIPKGPTGKLQRIGLAERLGVGDHRRAADGVGKPRCEPQSEVEKIVAEIWEEVLRVAPVGLDDDFLELGGDSMLATQVVSRVRSRLEVELTVASFFDASTVKDQAAIIEALLAGEAERQT